MNNSLNNNSAEIIEPGLEPQIEESATLEAAQKQVKGLLTDLKSERTKRQDVEKRLLALEEKDRIANEEKLKADGQLQQLLDSRTKELEDVKSQMISLKQKADSFDELENQEREEAKTKLGDKWDDGYANIPIKTLRKLVSTVTVNNAIDTDNGSGVKPQTKIKLTKDQESERDLMFSNIADEKTRTENYIYVKGLDKGQPK